jgi:hypothetical protein
MIYVVSAQKPPVLPVDHSYTNGWEERIKSCRLHKIKDLLEIPYAQARNLCSLNAPDGVKCIHKIAECDFMMFGSLAVQLTKLDLWPARDSTTIDKSVSQLAADLKLIKVCGHPGSLFLRHTACNTVDMEAKVKEVISQTSNPVSDKLRQHMKDQKARLMLS